MENIEIDEVAPEVTHSITKEIDEKRNINSKRYDQALIICNIEKGKGTVKIQEIVRKNVMISEEQILSDNKSIDQRHKGLSKYWFDTNTIKEGQIIQAIEKGIGSTSYLQIVE